MTVRKETGQLGAGAGSARRSIVSATGAKNEVAALCGSVPRRAKQLDVIDKAAICTGYAVSFQGMANALA